MNIYLTWAVSVLYIIVYPVYLILYYLAFALKALLSPLSSAVLFLLQPLFVFGHVLAVCALAPARFLQRFETVYIYLGLASLTGLLVGLILHFLYAFLHSSLSLASDPVARGPTSKQYRASRKRKANLYYDPMLSPATPYGSLLDTPGRGRHGLLAQTIHEEDSDF